jgi:hypothetical protein
LCSTTTRRVTWTTASQLDTQPGTWLYLFDVPEGSCRRILAIAIVAPAAPFERAVKSAQPIVDSVEFHAL